MMLLQVPSFVDRSLDEPMQRLTHQPFMHPPVTLFPRSAATNRQLLLAPSTYSIIVLLKPTE